MKATRFGLVLVCTLGCFVAGAALAVDVPGTKVNGKSAQEPPAPPKQGNPFPPNPEKPLKNPLRDDTKNLNPQNDKDVQRGIQENYKKHQSKEEPKKK